MAKRKPQSDCGSACKALEPKHFALHLLALLIPIPDVPPKTQREAYRMVYGDKKSGDQLASRVFNSAKFLAAMEHHVAVESNRVGVTRQWVLDRLALIAATGEVKTADLVTVRARPDVSREALSILLDLDDDEERAEGLRKLLEVQLLPWEGEGAIDPELTRGVAVKQKRDGTVELVPPPLSAANAALAQLRAMLALDEKSATDEALEKLATEFAAIAKRVLPADEAAKLADAIGGEED